MVKVQTVIEEVEKVLAVNPYARNNDSVLIAEVLERRYNVRKISEIRTRKDLPSFETITRARRFIQNTQGKYQSDKQTERLRKRKEKEIKEML